MTALRSLLGLARLAAGRVAAACAPVAGIVSPLGAIVALAAVAAGVASAVLGWAELSYLALTLVCGLLVAALFLIGRASYRVTIELSPRRVVAGERAFGRLLVANAGSRRASAGRLELPVGRGRAEFDIPALAPGAEHEELFAVPTAHRAVIVAGPAIAVRGDQLGLLRRRVRWADPIELFVHPRTALLAPSAAGLVKDLEGRTTPTLTSNDLAFHALRPYVPGDDRRYIHWRTTARTGVIMVRQFEETRRSDLVLLHHAERRAYADPDSDDPDAEFELGVSVAASVAVQTIRDGTRSRILGEEAELRTATVGALLDDSCRLAPVQRYATPRDFARAATALLPAPAVVVFVTGSRTPVAELRAIETAFPPDTDLVAIRVERGGEPRLQVVSRLRVLTVTELGDLPKLLRRIS
ncbi:DUF58 domain-containing protein [Pseudolysinimonas kribbensis]|uniref:DUF58 domain-containing protein n=1 Tax=Pseudolysinimonas kribbensis TaxID=433641 RepID=UPI0031D9F794